MAAARRTGEVSLARGWSGDLPQLGWATPVIGGPIDEAAARCLALWQAALTQIVEDSCSVRMERDARLFRDAARIWLESPSLDRAGVDLTAFLARGLPRLRERWVEVDVEIEAKAKARAARMREAPQRRAIDRVPAAGAPEALAAA
jgi:hypothetical protein